jgi:hypothetical protein
MAVNLIFLLDQKTALCQQLCQTFRGTVLFRGYIKQYVFILLLDIINYRGVQQEVDYVEGEDLCVY